jgi:UDP-N-acetylmuramyl pentapeptide phosphotransferase/UDP-N-acetylglucosamine-1-phosphate transferase
MFLNNLGRVGRMSHGEYNANLNGLGIFFGAVLGFVMASTENLTNKDYVLVLFTTAAMVITILYISSSRHRIAYSILALGFIAALPYILGLLVSPGAQLPPKLQPTLAVWLVMTLIVEFNPRDRDADKR